MSDAFLALISLSSFSGDSSFSFVWGLFLCFPSLVVALCLCLCIRLICFDSMSCGMALCVRGPVGPTGVDSLNSDLDALGMTSVWVMFSLRLYLGLIIIGPFVGGNSPLTG